MKFKHFILAFLICIFLTGCSLFGDITEEPTKEPTIVETPTVEPTVPVPTPTPTPEAEITEIYAKCNNLTVSINQEFNNEGITVYAKYSDNSEVNITNDVKFSSIDTKTKGEKELTITYGEFNVKLKINVLVPTGITLDTEEVTKLFELGQTIDISKLVIYNNYEDDITETTNSYNISIKDPDNQYISLGTELTKLGVYTINIRSNGFDSSYQIEVVSDLNVTYSLNLDKTKVKINFLNEDFNYEGLKVAIIGSDESEQILPSTDYKVELLYGTTIVDDFDFNGEYTVKVTYLGSTELTKKEATYNINYTARNKVVTFGYSGSGVPTDIYDKEITTNVITDYIDIPEGYYFDGFSTPFNQWNDGDFVKIYLEKITNSNKRYITLIEDNGSIIDVLEYNVNTRIQRENLEIIPFNIPEGKSFLYWDMPFSFIIKNNMVVEPVYGPNTINVSEIEVDMKTSVGDASSNVIVIKVSQFLNSTPEGFSLDSITIGQEGNVIAEIPYTKGMVSAYFDENITANTNYEVGAYYSMNQESTLSLRKNRTLTYRFHFVGFMVLTTSEVKYRVRMMYNGDCLYRWYFAPNTIVKNYDFYYSFQLPIKYDGYTCVGSKNKVDKITENVDLEAELIPPAGETCTVVFYDKYYMYESQKNILKIEEVPLGGSATAPSIDYCYTEENFKYEFYGWSDAFTNVNGNVFCYPMYSRTPIGNYKGEIIVTVGDTFVFVCGDLVDAFDVWVCYRYKIYEEATNELIIDSYMTELHYTNKRLETGLKPNTNYVINFEPEIHPDYSITLDVHSLKFTTRKGTEKSGYNIKFQANSYQYGTSGQIVGIAGYVEYQLDADGNKYNLCDARASEFKKHNTTYYVDPLIRDDNCDNLLLVCFDSIKVTTLNAFPPSVDNIVLKETESGYDLTFNISDDYNVVWHVALYYKKTDISKYLDKYITNTGGQKKVSLNLLAENHETGENSKYELADAYIKVTYIFDGIKCEEKIFIPL